MIELAAVREALCVTVQDVDNLLTITPYKPTVVSLPCAWIEIDLLEPASFGNDTWNITGKVVICVSEAEDDASWAALDSYNADRIAKALELTEGYEVELISITDYGVDIEVAGQAFRSLAIQFVVMA